VTSRLDVLRSLIRQARDRAGSRLKDLPPVAAFRKAMEMARAQRVLVKNEVLTAALAHADGVDSASVSARDGSIRIDARFRDGEELTLALVPRGARFAPHGAKEVAFGVVPPEAARHPKVLELASALAGAIARGLWGFLLPRGPDDGLDRGALVDRDGDDGLRVDLRGVPSVRKLADKGGGVFLDIIELGSIRAEAGGLTLDIKLPGLRA
jgi:hypothetical protein